MYQKTETKVYKTPHSHFVQDIADGRVRLVDAPPIRAELDPDMFSLSVNRLNKQNLQPVMTELSNRLDAISSLNAQVSELDKSISEYQHEMKVKQDIENFKKEYGEQD